MIRFAAIDAIGGDVTELGRSDIIAASVTSTAVSGVFASFEAVGDIGGKGDASGIFRAFFVRFASCREAVTIGGVGITDGSLRTIIGGTAFITDAGFTTDGEEEGNKEEY